MSGMTLPVQVGTLGSSWDVPWLQQDRELHEHESPLRGTEVPKLRAFWTGVRRKWRKHKARVHPATNISWSPPEAPLPPEDTDQPATGQRRPWSRPGSITGGALPASSCTGGHDDGPEEELTMPSPSPRMGQARHHAWESEHAPCILHDSQASSNLDGQVVHHLVQEEHLGPTVAGLEEPHWLERFRSILCQERFETLVLELQPASPASSPDVLNDAPAVASAPVVDPELAPHGPSCSGSVAPAGMAPSLAEPDPHLEPTHSHETSTQDVPRKESPAILAFCYRLVAEQVTLICAGLYTRIDDLRCNTDVQNQPQTGVMEPLACTMRRVLRGFHYLVKLVTTTCLRTPSMTAQERAQVVELWIRVAQSRVIRRLESTWGHVPRICLLLLRHMKKKNKWVHSKWLFKETPSVVFQSEDERLLPRRRRGSDMVPILELFLDNLPEEKLLEHEEVSSLHREIMRHKNRALMFKEKPEEHFVSFLQHVELLDEEERTEASCPTMWKMFPFLNVTSCSDTNCCLGAISHRVMATGSQEDVGAVLTRPRLSQDGHGYGAMLRGTTAPWVPSGGIRGCWGGRPSQGCGTCSQGSPLCNSFPCP